MTSPTTLTKELENRKMLAALLGIDGDEAAQRLEITVLVTAARDDTVALRIGQQIQAMLGRTVRATSEGACASHPAVEVIVGSARPRTIGLTQVWVGSVSDGIRVSTEPFLTIPAREHSIFGLIAACYACGMALRYALGRGKPLAGSDTILVSPGELLGIDLGLIHLPCELGEALLAGAGAVGNGFLYGLQHFRIVGRLQVVDPKIVHDGVLNRCIWFGQGNIGEAKAVAIVNLAQPHFRSLELVPYVATVHEIASVCSPGIARLITTVDSRRARRSLQNEIPREVFDASTTGMAELVLHFNEQSSNLACLACVYRQEQDELQHEAHVAEALGVGVEDVREGFISRQAAERLCLTFPDLRSEDVQGKAYDTLFKAQCAQGRLLTAADRQVLAPFCFVSILAGAYLALELVRRVNSGRITKPYNYWRISPWHNPVTTLRALRGSVPACQYCTNAVLKETAAKLWGLLPTKIAGSAAG